MLNKTKYLLIVLLLIAPIFSYAQIGHNFSKVDIGFAGYGNTVYGDIDKIKQTLSGSASISFNPHSPFVNYIAELQVGRLAGGDSVNSRSKREFKNDYVAYVLQAQVQAGEFIDYSRSQIANILKNVYVSTGVGLVTSNINEISRTSAQLNGYYSPGKDKSTQFFIPIRTGYEIKIFDAYNEPSIKIDMAYQWNIMTGDNLDGFNTGTSRDIWTQFTVGVKFAIGGTTSYRKPISH